MKRERARHKPKRLYIVPYHDTPNGPGHDPDPRPKSRLRYAIVATYIGGAIKELNRDFKTHVAAAREMKVMEDAISER